MEVVDAVADRWCRHHEVSILIAGGTGVGRCFGCCPRKKVSMMIMRLPQQGQGCCGCLGSSGVALAALMASIAMSGTASNSRARAIFLARVWGDYLKQHWPVIREQLLNGTYEPKPVRRVEIPKPDGGGVRKLGIPTVLDRFIQQAVMQVLQRQWNPTFSQYSYGIRPRRSAHHAVAQAQQYIAQGHGWVIDLDLEKFFDRVNHDKLMGQIAKRVEDKRLLKLIRASLNDGEMVKGLVRPV